MLDKMSAHCTALSVAAGDKKYIDGACVLADADGDKIFSTFDTRDLDKSQPDMKCGTHIITGGTGKSRASLVKSRLLATECLHLLVEAAIRQWISHITQRGKSGASSPPASATARARFPPVAEMNRGAARQANRRKSKPGRLRRVAALLTHSSQNSMHHVIAHHNSVRDGSHADEGLSAADRSRACGPQ